MSSACARRAVVASTCVDGTCPKVPGCEESEQQLPETCDQERGLCHGVPVPSDEIVCEDCYDLLDRLNVGSPLGPCACTYCGLQISAASRAPRPSQRRSGPRRAMPGAHRVRLVKRLRGQRVLLRSGVGIGHTCLRRKRGQGARACSQADPSVGRVRPDDFPANLRIYDQLIRDSVIERATEVAKCVSGDPHIQGRHRAHVPGRCALSSFEYPCRPSPTPCFSLPVNPAGASARTTWGNRDPRRKGVN